ncbi:MAG: glycosyltransferase family 39 protein [Taibaiella sp.]|nr:glycosyltransferase family 39 protein [Taibaiella sp.]
MNYIKYFLIAIAGCILFLPFLGQAHLFDWDEINFAECAREMIVTKDYVRAQIDFMPFWEKPPVFIWMQVVAMKMFGIGDYAARFPNAVMGIATLLTLFYCGKKIINEKMGLWWAGLYAATWLPHFYFKSGIIDPTFNFFIFLSFFQFHLIVFTGNKLRHAILSGLFLGIAVLTKGPVAVLVAGLSLIVYMLANRGIKGFTVKHLLTVSLFALVPFFMWIGFAVAVYGLHYGQWFLTEFLTYQVRLFTTEDADHGGPFIYHFIVLLIGCFPASAFLFQFGRKDAGSSNAPARDFTKLMWIMFWVVLILFSIVKTKIVHYSSLCYFPLTFLGALQVYRLSEEGLIIKKLVKGVLLFIAALWAIILIALPLVGLNKEKIIPYIDDKFAVGNLEADVPWHYAESLWGVLYITGIVAGIILIKKNFRQGILLMFAVQLVIIQVTIYHFTPKIEAYSQRAAIEYYESFNGQDVYVTPLGYKSYANLFYTKKRNFAAPKYYLNGKVNEQWLLTGATDKPAFFIGKIQNEADYDAIPQLEKTGKKNGFVFYRRK